MQIINLDKFTSAEIKLITILWDSGSKKDGDYLVPRRVALKSAGAIKNKSGILTKLYNSLVKYGYAEFNIRYIAKAKLC